jgi:serine protease Do
MNYRLELGVLTCAAAALLLAPAANAQSTRRETRAVALFPSAQTSYLGIGVADITSERAKALNLKEDRGAEVTSVEDDSPAAKAGLKEGDVILEFNGQAVQGQAQLARLVQETPAGCQGKILVSRGGATQTVTATIGSKRSGPAAVMGMRGEPFNMPEIRIPELPDIPRVEMNLQSRRLGIVGEALDPEDQLSEFFGVKEGVLVKSVLKNSAAEKAGLKAGDVVVKVGDTKVARTEEITRALRNVGDKSSVSVVVVRNKKEMTVPVAIEGTPRGKVRAEVQIASC